MSDYPTDPADILERAAEVLETEGWTQEEFRTPRDKFGREYTYCAIGAIRQAAGWYKHEQAVGWDQHEFRLADPDCAEAVESLVHLLEKDLTEHGHDLITLNDDESTTADMIIDLMKHTAKDLRNRKEAA